MQHTIANRRRRHKSSLGVVRRRMLAIRSLQNASERPQRHHHLHLPRIFVIVRQRLMSLRPVDIMLIMRLSRNCHTLITIILNGNARIRRRRVASRIKRKAKIVVDVVRHSIRSTKNISLIKISRHILLHLSGAAITRVLSRSIIRIRLPYTIKVRHIPTHHRDDVHLRIVIVGRKISSRPQTVSRNRHLRRNRMNMNLIENDVCVVYLRIILMNVRSSNSTILRLESA